ncbi:MAG: hypothetical protein ACK4ZD_10075 [Caldimonas sp.]|uniref:hypothetical protein n=1 Tax=Caldimonas sp. TaxID=2838790 RepID=UPI00391C5986
MSGFSADWLALREPWDHAAREVAARRLDAAALAGGLRPADGILGVLDLACGTGANLRELGVRLGGEQRWTLVDHDPALLDALPAALQQWAQQQGHASHIDADGRSGTLRCAQGRWRVRWQARRLDLATELERLPWEGVQLLTASALIDLVSEAWLRRLVAASRAHGAALWMALGVDGRDRWAPSDPDDAMVRAAFRAHQRRDKGFGPALGPQAPQSLARQLANAGYRVTTTPSDWRLDGPAATALRRALVEGISTAACEQQPVQAPTFRAWAARRQAQIERLSLHIGHTEVVGRLSS